MLMNFSLLAVPEVDTSGAANNEKLDNMKLGCKSVIASHMKLYRKVFIMP